MYYVCTELGIADNCIAWAEYQGGIPALSIQDAHLIGVGLLLVCVSAWGAREIYRMIVNR